MSFNQQRYAVCFTPAPHEALGIVGASWVGRNAFSGAPIEPPMLGGLSLAETAFYTAVPRRYGFHGMLKSPFYLSDGMNEAMLLNALMRFATDWQPFWLPRLKIVRLRNSLAFVPALAVPQLEELAAAAVSALDGYRAPLSEAELERRDTGFLTPDQFENLHRWGEPDVMSAFFFHMPLTGPLKPRELDRMERAAFEFFEPILQEPVEFENIALFVEEEPGAPFRVHSLHPMGALPARRIA